jgi:hypothetical protein
MTEHTREQGDRDPDTGDTTAEDFALSYMAIVQQAWATLEQPSQDITTEQPTEEQPTDECRLSPAGLLLAGGKARYDTLEEYRQQLGAPISSLPGLGYWTFPDPLVPECTLLVRTMPRERCADCGHQLDHCECPC